MTGGTRSDGDAQPTAAPAEQPAPAAQPASAAQPEARLAAQPAPAAPPGSGAEVPAAAGRAPGAAAPDDDVVPRLPRGRGLRLSRPEMFRIAGLTLVLVFLLVAQRPCANAVSSFVTGFGDRGSTTTIRPGSFDRPGSAQPAMPPGPATSPSPAAPSPAAAAGAAPGSAGAGAAPGSAAAGDLDRYEHLRPGMTDAEIKAVIERARARAGSANSAPP